MPKRLLLILLFFLALFGIVRFLLWAIVLFQLIAHLLTGRATQLGMRWERPYLRGFIT